MMSWMKVKFLYLFLCSNVSRTQHNNLTDWCRHEILQFCQTLRNFSISPPTSYWCVCVCVCVSSFVSPFVCGTKTFIENVLENVRELREKIISIFSFFHHSFYGVLKTIFFFQKIWEYWGQRVLKKIWKKKIVSRKIKFTWLFFFKFLEFYRFTKKIP